VSEDNQGEALGALNGIRALTEGFGPLLFGFFMALFENTPFPGAPYVLASLLSFWSFLHCFELHDDFEVEYSKHDAQRKGFEESQAFLSNFNDDDNYDDEDENVVNKKNNNKKNEYVIYSNNKNNNDNNNDFVDDDDDDKTNTNKSDRVEDFLKF
jgi:ABC-type antimicrobial peptide transport system permease subunit